VQTKQTGQDTARKTSFVRCDLLRPGDVILNTSPNPRSRVTAVLSSEVRAKGRFSHAAIVWNTGFLFEADEVLAAKPLTIAKAGWVEGSTSPLVLLHDVSGFASFAVYRHPDFENGVPPEKARRLDELVQQYWAKQYPALTDLALAAAGTVPGQAVARLGLWMQQRWGELFSGEERPEIPGPFCSKLVALIFEELKLETPLFDRHQPAFTVSPNALAKHSCLRRVKKAVVSSVPGLVEDPTLAASLNRALLLDFRGAMSLEDAARHDHDRRIANVETAARIHRFHREAEELAKELARRRAAEIKKLKDQSDLPPESE